MTAPPPDDRSARRNLLRLFAVVLIFAALAWPFRFVGTVKSPAWIKLDELNTSAHPLDFAIVGDSRAHVGLSPTVLADGFVAAGLPRATGHNFAVDGSDALHHYSFTLRGLLAEKVRPKIVIWAPSPLSVDLTRAANRLEQLSTRDVKALAFAGAPLEVLLDLLTSGVFGAFRHRPQVRDRVEGFVEIAEERLVVLQKTGLRLDYEKKLRPRVYREQPDGQEPFVTIGDWGDRFERGLTGYRVNYERLQLSEWHLRIARSLMRRCKERGVLLVMIELPVSPTYQREFGTLHKHQEWQRRMQELAAEEGAVWISDAKRFDDDKLFGDPAHMELMTAMPYSWSLAARLAAIPSVRAALAAERP